MVPDGMTSEVHSFDAREGGTFRISLHYDQPTTAGKTSEQTDSFQGRFVKLVPDTEVVQVVEFETDDPSMQGEMTITYRLSDTDRGTTLVGLHEHLPPGLSAADNELGWSMAIAKLASLVETSDTPAASGDVDRIATHGSHRNHHGHVHLDEADWEALAAQTELEGELLLAFVTDSGRWIAELHGPDAPAVRRVLDIGSGPGVGTCELARLFPHAHVVAVDGSPAMLERALRRADTHGLARRISTHLAELPDGLDALERADVIWASMSLHHVGDEVNALRVLRDLLAPSGLLALAEAAEPTRVLPDDLDVGRPGLAERIERAESGWFEAMRANLPGSVASGDLETMVASAGLEVIGTQLLRERFDPPLPGPARRFVMGRLSRTRQRLGDVLDGDDLRALDVLVDPEGPRSVVNRPDVFLAASRRIVLARA